MNENLDELLDYLFSMHGPGKKVEECQRLQLMRKNPDGTETALGGWCRESVRSAIVRHLGANQPAKKGGKR